MVTLSGGPGSTHAGVFQARPEGSRAHKDDSFSRRDTRRLRPRRPRVCTAGVCGPRDSLRRGAACAPGDARQHLRPAPTETPAADPGGVHDHPVVNPACRAQSHSVLGGQSRCARGRDPTRRVCDALRTARGRLSAVRGVGRAGQGTSRPIAGPGNEQAAGGWTDGQGGERTQPLRLLPSQEEAVLSPSQTQGGLLRFPLLDPGARRRLGTSRPGRAEAAAKQMDLVQRTDCQENQKKGTQLLSSEHRPSVGVDILSPGHLGFIFVFGSSVGAILVLFGNVWVEL